ncbi:putative ocs element-binding factor 1 [Iris pallida]|uniref:Ocs element-binding factor 1 n=1 Tax=Iris pallida TaxID=29817 RepID=A0AAX6DWG0_IRIPA|nr:putative ocs element-binding factor 1 [Iris pallida]KAJ6796177.1 putative ocs element-binding factor 1 [Iris pallida]
MSSYSQSRSSSPSQQPSSASSQEDPKLLLGAEDQRKRKRMISNRESARRSRMRKQQRLDDLLAQAAQLRAENERISVRIGATSERLVGLDGGNAVLRAQVAELSDRLRSLGSVLRFVEEFSEVAVDVPEMPEDPLLRPWQLPCPAPYPVMASDVFGF